MLEGVKTVKNIIRGGLRAQVLFGIKMFLCQLSQIIYMLILLILGNEADGSDNQGILDF